MPFARFDNECLINGKSFGEYYVVFCESDAGIPFIKREFSHCYAVKWTISGWVALNPALGFSELFVLESVDPDIRVALAGAKYTDIIRVSAWRKTRTWRTPWPVAFTCVEQIKALLGISAWWVLTPRQLHKYLGGIS